MCGISGFYNSYGSFEDKPGEYRSILDNMITVLKQRGPDDNGYLLTQKCGMAHTRLSIIDLENGHQPMTRVFSSGDSNYKCSITYNGEIYNTNELRDKLLSHNIKPSTSSDTEILLLSFMEFGPEFIKNVDGIYAFAIYDHLHESLTIFRDCFGVKPLFYTSMKNTKIEEMGTDPISVVFSSEIKGLLQYNDVKASIDRTGLCELFGLGPARNPGNAVFEGIHELLPGSYMTFSKYGCNVTQYYRLQSHPHEDSYEATIEVARELITSAIKRQMVSDVPICTFLSGGVDSSVVSAVCSSELKKHNKQLKTFSFDFTENNKYFKANSFQPSSDRPFVEKMVDYLGSDHTYLECMDTTQADFLYKSVDAHDLPCMADIDSSLLYFCGQVAQNNKVVLTGECADEIFGGYPWFHRQEMLGSNTFPWTPDLTPRKEMLNPEILHLLRLDEYVQASYNKAISEIDILPGENATETSRRRIGYLNIRYFMQTLLNRMDRTSMYSGLEARVPFADKKLVDYIFNVPWNMKAHDGVVKNVLRQACRGLLPDEILFRRKSPYPKTYNPFYEQILSQRLLSILDNNSSPILTLIDKNSVRRFLSNTKDYGKPWYGQLMAGPQMIAYLLQINYWLEKYNIKIDL